MMGLVGRLCENCSPKVVFLNTDGCGHKQRQQSWMHIKFYRSVSWVLTEAAISCSHSFLGDICEDFFKSVLEGLYVRRVVYPAVFILLAFYDVDVIRC